MVVNSEATFLTSCFMAVEEREKLNIFTLSLTWVNPSLKRSSSAPAPAEERKTYITHPLDKKNKQPTNVGLRPNDQGAVGLGSSPLGLRNASISLAVSGVGVKRWGE